MALCFDKICRTCMISSDCSAMLSIYEKSLQLKSNNSDNLQSVEGGVNSLTEMLLCLTAVQVNIIFIY